MLYLKTTQGSQGRGQGSETIVRQVKMSDQQQLFQMAEHRQVLRRRNDIPNGEGPQPSFMRHLPSVPHTGPEERRGQAGSLPYNPPQYMLQVKDMGQT